MAGAIDQCWQPARMGDKDASNRTASEDTMTLEEDELLERSSQLTEYVSSYEDSSCTDDEDDISCSTMQSDLDEAHDFYRSEHASDVKFAKMATKYLYMTRREFTQDEIEDAWWTPNQREVLNKAHNKTVDRLEAGLKEKKSSPYRGLEKIAIEGYQRMVNSKNAYVDAVMDEMERQWREDNSDFLDWERIANLTRQISRQSTQEALTIALYDESEAREAYQTIKVKDLKVPQLRPSVSNISNISEDMDSMVMELLEDDDELDDEAVGKLGRLDSSIRLTKERGLVSPKQKKKKIAKKKKAKASIKQEEEGQLPLPIIDVDDDDDDLTTVAFDDDDSGVFDDSLRGDRAIEGEEESESGEGEINKKKKRRKKKGGKSVITQGDRSSIKEKKRKNKCKTASTETDSTFSGITTNKKEEVAAAPMKNNKKSPVSKFAATCVQRFRARAA